MSGFPRFCFTSLCLAFGFSFAFLPPAKVSSLLLHLRGRLGSLHRLSFHPCPASSHQSKVFVTSLTFNSTASFLAPCKAFSLPIAVGLGSPLAQERRGSPRPATFGLRHLTARPLFSFTDSVLWLGTELHILSNCNHLQRTCSFLLERASNNWGV